MYIYIYKRPPLYIYTMDPLYIYIPLDCIYKRTRLLCPLMYIYDGPLYIPPHVHIRWTPYIHYGPPLYIHPPYTMDPLDGIIYNGPACYAPWIVLYTMVPLYTMDPLYIYPGMYIYNGPA